MFTVTVAVMMIMVATAVCRLSLPPPGSLVIVTTVAADGETSAARHKTAPIKRVIRVFVSSTFTDTVFERNYALEDVIPYLKMAGRERGFDVGSEVPVTWCGVALTGSFGIRDDASQIPVSAAPQQVTCTVSLPTHPSCVPQYPLTHPHSRMGEVLGVTQEVIPTMPASVLGAQPPPMALLLRPPEVHLALAPARAHPNQCRATPGHGMLPAAIKAAPRNVRHCGVLEPVSERRRELLGVLVSRGFHEVPVSVHLSK